MSDRSVRAGMNHVGVCVGDIDAAVAWYTEVLGLLLLDGPMDCDTTTAGASRRKEVFGERWASMRLAHLLTANSCGLELFQFIEPRAFRPSENFEYEKFGPNHLAFTVADFDAAHARIIASGGRARTAVHDVNDNTLICYCEDPWGNVIEIVSRPYAELSVATTKP